MPAGQLAEERGRAQRGCGGHLYAHDLRAAHSHARMRACRSRPLRGVWRLLLRVPGAALRGLQVTLAGLAAAMPLTAGLKVICTHGSRGIVSQALGLMSMSLPAGPRCSSQRPGVREARRALP